MANERALLVQLIDKINHDQVMLPSLPQVAMAVLNLAQQSTCTLPQLANEISKDPGLSASMIKLANQTSTESANQAYSVISALTQLGLAAASEAAISAVNNQLFYAEQPWIWEQFEQLQHANWTLVSTALAILACEHSRGHLLNLNADTLKLACQVHNIVRLPVLVQVDLQPQLFTYKAELSGCLTRLQGPLGSVLLTQYQFPSELVEVARYWRQFSYQTRNPSYLDLVRLAALFARQETLADPLATSLALYVRKGVLSNVDVFCMESYFVTYAQVMAQLSYTLPSSGAVAPSELSITASH